VADIWISTSVSIHGSERVHRVKTANVQVERGSGGLGGQPIDVATVDQDIAYVVIAIHVCFKCMFQMFHLFQTNIAGVLSGCCKSRSRYCIYMHVVSICFKCFIYMFASV
jgi:hypothetical protein